MTGWSRPVAPAGAQAGGTLATIAAATGVAFYGLITAAAGLIALNGSRSGLAAPLLIAGVAGVAASSLLLAANLVLLGHRRHSRLPMSLAMGGVGVGGLGAVALLTVAAVGFATADTQGAILACGGLPVLLGAFLLGVPTLLRAGAR